MPALAGGVDVQAVLNSLPDGELCDAVTMLVTDAQFATSGPVLLRVLGNIAVNPGEPKFRRLRMSNAKVQAAVVDTSGGLELLRGVGFDLEFEAGEGQEEGFLVLPQDCPVQHVQQAVKVLHRLLPACPLPVAAAPAAPPAHERGTVVLLPTQQDTDVPDWFFEVTSMELKSLYAAAVKRRQQSEMLMTNTMREQLAPKAGTSQYSTAVVRVRLPEGLLLQGSFRGSEPVSAVFDWVTAALQRPDLKYELVLPDRKLLAPGEGMTVESADLPPSTLLNFRWSDERKGEVAQRATLKQELLDQAQADVDHEAGGS